MSVWGERCAAGVPLLGLWQALATPYTAEICAGAGYDWLLFDGEHAPNTAQTLLGQLQAMSSYPVHPIARPPVGEAAIIKQYLDIGFETLLVPMVESAAQAVALVEATRFPPRGVRGVASATSRASRFGSNRRYLAEAHTRTALICQVETRAGLANVREIAEVDGVEALFIGPSDLAASLGHLGEPLHAEVQAAIGEAHDAIRAVGKPAGIFAVNADDARARVSQGFSFISVGTDIGVLASGAAQLRAACTPR